MKISNMIANEIIQLERIVKNAQERVKEAPAGFLRIAKKKKGVEYYWKKGNDNNCLMDTDEDRSNNHGVYIRKRDMEIAYKLAQRDYDTQIIKLAEKKIRALKKWLRIYGDIDLGDVLINTNSYRKTLLKEVILPDDEYIKQWQEVEYKGKIFDEGSLEIYTEKGERVRSKSEKIIADKLYSLGIPYRYEYPLMLDGNITVYPDFTILKMPEREEVYLEHLGMLDKESYVDTVMYKLETYERCGIYVGVNLFFTHETGKRPLDSRVLDKMMKRIFC